MKKPTERYLLTEIKGLGFCFWCLDRQTRYYDAHVAALPNGEADLTDEVVAGTPAISEAMFIVDGTGFCSEHATATLRARHASTALPADGE